MNKKEFIQKVSQLTKMTKKDVEKVWNAGLEVIKNALSKSRPEDVAFVGFGTFTVVKKKARTGRNPKTGETIKIPARRVPKFKPGKELKKAVAR